MHRSERVFALLVALAALPSPARAGEALWIWADPRDPAPKNRFTYFRKVVDLAALPEDPLLRFAADSNARLWINGEIVRRKVARYHEPRIAAEVVNAGPYLRVGRNVIVVLHHNWGDIITFQRTGNLRAGLFLRADGVATDPTWRWLRAPEFVEHAEQIVGVIGDRRIRYPQIIDGRRPAPAGLHAPDFDDSSWARATVVADGPWPAVPADLETPGQREVPERPLAVLAAGRADRTMPLSDDPLSIAPGIRTAILRPEPEAGREAEGLVSGRPATIEGKAGETRYITFDFHRPVHGYPFLVLQDAPDGTRIDLGYAEIARAHRTGLFHVDRRGWIDPEGVVGRGYADRIIARRGSQAHEIPDERTARWLAVHIHFPADGRVVVRDIGIVKSQYPIEPVGSFSCGDERIERIVKLCLIHAEVSMTDAYVDTPGREDGQWIEDDRPRAILAAQWFGDARLRQFLLRTHAEGQRSDGNLHPFSPSNYPAYPAPYDWSVQWIACFYDDWIWTGSAERIRRYWDRIVRYWDEVLRHVGADGIWRTDRVLADIRIGLHPQHSRQSSGIVTPWIIERLRWSAEMARAIGEDARAASWRSAADRMAEAFRRHHIVPARDGIPAHVADRLDPDDPSIEHGYSQAGQTVAVWTGLLTPEEARADLAYAFREPDGSPPPGVSRWNNPTYGYRALRALSEAGFAELAVRHLIERYAPYLPAHPRNPVPLELQGPYGGPLPEYWVSREDLGLAPGEKNPAQPDDETGSHGWGAVPLIWLHDTLLGVRIVEPGGGRIRVAPNAAGLPYVAGHTMTPKGHAWVFWDPRAWAIEVGIPAGVRAELVPPPECAGKRLAVIRADGEAALRPDGAYELEGAGTYRFEVR